MTEHQTSQSFWSTLPGILTGLAALVTAVVGGLALFLTQVGDGDAVASGLPTVTDEGDVQAAPDTFENAPPRAESPEEPAAAPDPAPGPSSTPPEPVPAGEPRQYRLFPGDALDIEGLVVGSDVTDSEFSWHSPGGGGEVTGQHLARVPSATDGPGCLRALQERRDDGDFSGSVLNDLVVVCLRTDAGTLAQLEIGPEGEDPQLPVRVTTFS